MTSAERYRELALEMCAFANLQSDPAIKVRIEDCAAVYMQLAEDADRELDLGDLLVKTAPPQTEAVPKGPLKYADWVRPPSGIS